MAQVIFIGVAQLRQTPTYVIPKFDFLTVLNNVEKYRITDLTLVPPVVVMLAKRPETKQFDLSSVERIGSGSAPLIERSARKLKRCGRRESSISN